MKCEDVSNELIGYLERRANSAERREVEEHLAGCAACRARAEEFRAISNLMGEMPAIEPSLGFDARIRERVAAEPQRRWFTWMVPQPRLALAAVLLIALTVWVEKLPPSNPVTLAPTTNAATSDQDFDAIKDLGVLENYDVLTKFDALSQTPSPDSNGGHEGAAASND